MFEKGFCSHEEATELEMVAAQKCLFWFNQIWKVVAARVVEDLPPYIQQRLKKGQDPGLALKHYKMATVATPHHMAPFNLAIEPTDMATAPTDSATPQTGLSHPPISSPIKPSTSSSAKPSLAKVAGLVHHIMPLPVPATSACKTSPPPVPSPLSPLSPSALSSVPASPAVQFSTLDEVQQISMQLFLHKKDMAEKTSQLQGIHLPHAQQFLY